MAPWLEEGACAGPLLALHSTTDVVAVAILDAGSLLASLELDSPRAAIRLPGEIERLLAQAELQASSLAKLAVCVGPGSFTGIKVGLATAFGLSAALRIGIVGVDSLEVMSAQAESSEEIAALLPAGRGDLYVAVFGAGEPGRRPVLQSPLLVTPAQVRPLLEGRRVLHLGCESLLEAAGANGPLEARTGSLARDLGLIASGRDPLRAGRLPDPLYLRRTWAEESRDHEKPWTGSSPTTS